MKRRRFFQTLVVAPAASAVLAQQPVSTQNPAGRPPSEEQPKLEATDVDQVADAVPHFFDAPQLSALRKLGGLLMPPMNGAPGAAEAGAAEFLDFLIGESPADRQQVYRAGLDALNAQAKTRYGKPFADVDAAQADALLAPLRAPWTYDPPADPLARFLVAAKQDVRTATMNSREWNTGGTAGGRRMGGTALYWYPVE